MRGNMKVTNRGGLSNGDTVALGENVVVANAEQKRGGLRLMAVSDGEEREYVVLSTTVDHGDELEFDGEVVAIESGPGLSSPTVWTLIDTEEYR